LPEMANPRRLCDLGKSFEGSLALSSFERLAPLLASPVGEVVYELHFDRGEKGRAQITGHIQATVQVVCQRCMEAMSYPVDMALSLALVSGPDEAERLTDEFDPVLIEDDEPIRLTDLLEDELLLALPVAPLHPVEACAVRPEDFSSEAEAEADAEADGTEKVNPFAVLAGLKSDKTEH